MAPAGVAPWESPPRPVRRVGAQFHHVCSCAPRLCPAALDL